MTMKRVDCLDGIRGIAALWVLMGHCMLLTGFKVPILIHPDLGVDLFILLSGFLMVLQYQMRQGFEDWDRPRTWLAFWIRRFFRIAPLFALIHLRSVSIIDSVSRLLGTKLLHWLGELSYGIYLVHLLILHSVAAWTIQRFGAGLGAGSRFAVVFAAVAAMGYSVALVTYFLIERPGQILGGKLLKNFIGSRRQAAADRRAGGRCR